MDNIELLIEETIKDLKTKVSGIQQAAGDTEGETGDKIAAIRDKAIKILDDVADKVSGLAEETQSLEEANRVVRTINEKSASLYENALAKIGELKRGADQTFVEVEDRQPTAKPADRVPDPVSVSDDAGDISEQIVATLRSWLIRQEDRQ